MDGLRSKLPGYQRSVFRDHGPDLRTGRDLEPRQWPLYALQDSLPQLPLPPLDETFASLLESLRPHTNDHEFQEVRRKLADFSQRRGLAEVLQQRLRECQISRPESSWLSELWNASAYLEYREPLPWNVSYYLQFRDEAEWAMRSPVRRAARFVYHALGYRQQLVSGQLLPDMNRAEPMCMSQHKFLFNTCRIPGSKTDFVRTYAPDVFGHIVVARKNRFYAVDVVDPASGAALGVDAITASLQAVVEDADRLGGNDGIGILSAMDRDDWYLAREIMTGDSNAVHRETNRAALAEMESSILLLCLDDTSPQTRNDLGRALVHSDGRNRFWDKSLQLVFFANGRGGCICEHSMTDGTTTTGMINQVLKQMSLGESMPTEEGRIVAGPWRAVEFELDKRLQALVKDSSSRFQSLMASRDLESVEFPYFGKEAIKSLGMSPDAFVQVAIQLVHYRVYGCFRGTYESIQTRRFLHGRTAVARSLTSDAVAFCRALEAGEIAREDCAALMRAATDAHSAYVTRAARGLDYDRHLFGLSKMLQQGESAGLFSDQAYIRSGTWSVSTSSLAGEFIDGWGFGEVVPDGIGIGYQLKSDRLFYTVCSGSGRARDVAVGLEGALREMWQIAGGEEV